MDSTSSRLLLQEAKLGSREALGRLLEALRPYLRIVARRAHRGLLAGRLDDSDLVQDAIVEVTQSFEGFRGSEVPEFLAWLRQVVANKVHMSVRRLVDTRKRYPEGGFAAREFDELTGPCPAPDRSAIVREETARFGEAVERLRDEMRRIVLLRLVDELPHADIAAQMGRSEQTVRMLFMRAVRRLCEEFNGSDF